MIAVFAFTIMLLTAAGAFVGANYCESGSTAQLSLVGLGSGLVGAVLPSIPAWLQSLTAKPTVVQQRDTQAGHAIPVFFFLGAFTFAAVIFALSAPHFGCANPNAPASRYLEATVDCSKINPHSSAAYASLMTCVFGAVAGNPAACVAGITNGTAFAIDEVTCVLAYVSQEQNKRVGAGDGDAKNFALRDEAANFLARNRVRILNSYPGE